MIGDYFVLHGSFLFYCARVSGVNAGATARMSTLAMREKFNSGRAVSALAGGQKRRDVAATL
jgi:hypothetical protein